MRELFAVELQGGQDSDNAAAWALIKEWAAEHEGGAREAGIGECNVEEAPSKGRALTLRQPHDRDASLRWRCDVAVGPPHVPLHVTVRVRLEALAGGALAPVEYDFGPPRIVRTILRECEVTDAGVMLAAEAGELGHSNIDALLALLEDPARRLPVVVISRTREAGQTLVDEQRLAGQLAGLAHVRVLASSHAAWRLTQAVGAPLSVWDGGVRVYFPRFTIPDDPYRHRLYIADRVDDGLVRRLRSWLSAVSSSRTPEHPVYVELREERRRRLREAADNAELDSLLSEEIDRLEQEVDDRASQIDELREENAQLRSHNETLQQNVEALSRAAVDQARSTPSAVASGEPQTVADAVACIEELAATAWYAARVTVSDQARRAALRFSAYRQPGELVRAVQAVLEAGALYYDGRLGEPPAEFFTRRGYGYAAQPEPHLKVDEATSPDQCLRIHWEIDPSTRRWTISHIGRHE